ncbi:hypothetical protein GCT19_33210 [Paraburkholderia sp. CNPSo 3155]|uniref:hypothetical protein n=1 Tax=Paraburkholderia atlantica TaxID=2654982 RepID=UPI00128B37F9|nr:hypothetical protein [Paraburkholderia atlantica]MPW10431.1 hypothetical protein [Paraburkholderia atlantica]
MTADSTTGKVFTNTLVQPGRERSLYTLKESPAANLEQVFAVEKKPSDPNGSGQAGLARSRLASLDTV